MNVLLITQARMASTRLPGKVLKEVDGRSLLQMHLERLAKAKEVNSIIVATTTKSEDDATSARAKELGFAVYRGSENDVLDRFYQAASLLSPKWVVRVTADCPLIDGHLVDEVIRFAIADDADYCSNCLEERFPDGQDIEVFKFKCLEEAWNEAKLLSEREHVTPYIRTNSSVDGSKKFTALNYSIKENYSHIRMTVDEPADFELIKKLVEELGRERTWKEYADYVIKNNLLSVNSFIARNKGYLKSLENDKNEQTL